MRRFTRYSYTPSGLLVPHHYGEIQRQLRWELSGRVQCSVVDARTGRVVRRYPEQCNLILNQGMDYLAAKTNAQCFLYAAAGTGSTATSVDSGSDTCFVTGTALQVSTTGYLAGTSADVGKTFKSDVTGLTYRVTAAVDTTHATVTAGGDMGDNETFILYNTNQTALTTESKRSTSYLTGSGNCGSSLASYTLSNYRTYDFAAETGSVTYNELGFSDSASSGSNLFSRVKLATGVALTSGQQLRVKYTLAITLAPTTSTAASIGTFGNFDYVLVLPALYHVSESTGANDAGTYNEYKVFEPSETGGTLVYAGLTTDTTALPTWNTNVSRATNIAVKACTSNTYTDFDWQRTKSATFASGDANRSDWRSIVWFANNASYPTKRDALTGLAGSSCTKDSSHTLTLTLNTAWTRTLST